MKRMAFVLPVLILIALATTAGQAYAIPGPPVVPEPGTIVGLTGLAAMGPVAWLWQGRKPRS